MNHIKHYSFDLWFTLIKSNPTFKKERALFFYKHFNSCNKSVDEVQNIFRAIDLMCNAINEKTGKNIDAEEMYLMVIYQLNNTIDIINDIDTKSLYDEMEKLIFKYSPTIFNSDTERSLIRLKEDSNTTLNILSNTAFIRGSTLRIILDELQISKYFDFQIYSDEVGLSKPNNEIYNHLLENIHSIRKTKDITLTEIVHVGDNPLADIYGATCFGIKAFQINSNEKSILNLFS